ncbi:hypothetical protein CMI38_02330 [Candidatus Pacearchaeota archaeon]|jgi:hypothetical protein|nr:hypothetical protein [Candidatus Pacearchaeota archaeon]|tara:strand:+ start:727 stop:1098 length:372 start_codon:yes stop_codon:yes gene_type:complete
MATKQKIEKEIVTKLKRANLFDNDLRITGNLSTEGSSITLRYKRKPTIDERTFEMERADIESRLEHTIIQNHPSVNFYIEQSDDYKELTFTRYPTGETEDPTIPLLNIIKDEVHEYLFRNGKA